MTSIQSYYNQIDPSYTVVYPSSFIKAIMWKDNPNLVSYNLTDKNSILNMLKQHAITQTLQIGFVSYGFEGSNTKQFLKDFLTFHQLESVAPFISHRYFFHGTCQPNLFDLFDVILISSELFPLAIRSHRSGNRKHGLYSASDFVSVYLEPFRVFQSSSGVALNFRNHSHEIFCNETIPLNSILIAYEGEIESYFRILNGENNTLFSESEVLFLNRFNSFAVPYLISQNISNQLKESIVNFYNISPNSTYLSFLFPECTVCQKDFCEDFFIEDYWFIPVAVLTIFHYLVLFISGAFKSPALKIRLLVPYLLPLGSLYFETQYSPMIANVCPFVRIIFVGYIITWFTITYGFTIFRFYYLRNLYHIISIKNVESTNKKIAFQRKISRPFWGILLTVGMALIATLILGSPFLVIVDTSISAEFGFLSNLLYAIVIGIGCVIGGIAIIIDVIFNRKILKEKGLNYYLFFDDPFLIRLELFTLSLTIIFMVICYFGNYYIFKVSILIIYCLVIMSSGFLASFKHILTKFMNRKKKEISNLEIYLNNDSFKHMLREYCIKEMSLENYKCYMSLEQFKMKKDKVIDLELMKQFETDYISLNSIYEVNIPSNVRKSFYELMKQVESSHSQLCEMAEDGNDFQQATNSQNMPIYSNLIELLSVHLLTNLGDTLSRLETTKEYKVWQQLYEIQSKSAVI
ncbi:predicted protein [Naegleria gruberi]|uniref:Predicted protein n=1 Tax=Naegleria gruberi TaxID=5762 RepID=D2VZU8_NAEGR|nr:uncharacterized protein NAEGRDRAFT_74625 [Naegleria gruberi]EFC37591.1 predicted protein [Naegleria gruberi]|eukprot:XP_002670335.1 predicted protein [Naegleria gruberi strain NEG-M]